MALVPGVAAVADADRRTTDGAPPHRPGRAARRHLRRRPAVGRSSPCPGPPTINNGITFPTPSQPVEGFSAIVEGRRPGEYLAMPDNGFGNKANSFDFLIRAYYLRPDFKTADGGSGTVDVGPTTIIEFRDPDG